MIFATVLATGALFSAVSAQYKYFITFGDSYSQTGFKINGTKPSVANILGNPAWPGTTTAPRENWIDYSIAKYNKSIILCYNFAYGGATTDAKLVKPSNPTIHTLVDQVSEFTDNLASKPSYAPWTASNTLIGIWMGINDIGKWNSSDWSTLVPRIVNRYFEEVQILYDSGARNFVFLTLPPIQYTPKVIAKGQLPQAAEAAAVATYNQLLSSALSNFDSGNSGVNSYLYNTTAPFWKAINNPTAYGAPNATCVNSNGRACLWKDTFHPGQAIHDLVAQGVAELTGI